MDTATLNAKGQITIPARMRKRLGLTPGSAVRIFLDPDDETLVVEPTHSVKEAFGCLPRPGEALSVEEMDKAMAREAAGEEAKRDDRD